MSDLTRQEIIKNGRILFHHRLCELYTERIDNPTEEIKSALEKAHIEQKALIHKFNKEMAEYLQAFEDKEAELKKLIHEMEVPFEEIITIDFSGLTETERDYLVGFCEYLLKKESGDNGTT